MKQSLFNFFNNQSSDIFVNKILSFLSLPLVILCLKLKFKPNLITSISNILALVSFYFIVFEQMFIYFIIFWVLSLLFDFADGIVARITNNKSAQGSFYDHFSDHIKILFLFLIAGIYYDSQFYWILVFIVSNLFIMISYLEYLIKFRENKLYDEEKVILNLKSKEKNYLYKVFKYYIVSNVTQMQGNFALYIGFVLYEPASLYILIASLIVMTYTIIRKILIVMQINRDIDKSNLKWN